MKFTFIFLILTTYLCASEPLATLMSLEGKVKVLSNKSIKKHTAKVNDVLYKGDKLITYVNSKVLLQLNDASTIILDANAELVFNDNTHLSQNSGEVYYQITSRPKHQGLQVETPFSIIGIKGTEFIVNFKDEGQIALNEGLVGITSPNAAFELYQEKKLSDFEKFQAKQQSDFKAYKQKFEDQIAAYVKSFELRSHKMLTFNKADACKESCEKQVVEAEFTQDINAKFQAYQQFINAKK